MNTDKVNGTREKYRGLKKCDVKFDNANLIELLARKGNATSDRNAPTKKLPDV